MERKYSLEKIYYVYQYLDPRTRQPFYIGKGEGKRHLSHLFETKDNTINFKKWSYIEGLRNKGLNPIIEKVQENMDEEAAYELEAELIKKYGRKDIDANGILTNMCIDHRPPEQLKGELNPRFGITRSEKDRQKMREARAKQSPPSEETRRKISKSMTGRTLSEEHRKNMCIAWIKRKEKFEGEDNV